MPDNKLPEDFAFENTETSTFNFAENVVPTKYSSTWCTDIDKEYDPGKTSLVDTTVDVEESRSTR